MDQDQVTSIMDQGTSAKEQDGASEGEDTSFLAFVDAEAARLLRQKQALLREVTKDYSAHHKMAQELIMKNKKSQRDQERAFQTDEAEHDAQMRVKKKALQAAKSAAEAAQRAVDEEEQAFCERQAQYEKERRVTTEAIKDSEEHRDALKRKFDADTESLENKIASFKRLRQSSPELCATISQSAALPTLTDVSDQPTSSDQESDELSAKGRPSPSQQPLHDDQAIAGGAGATTQDGTSEQHSDEHSAQDELSNPSSLQVPSVGNGDRSSHKSQSRPPPLTRRTVPYDEVYNAARDPQAKRKHWIFEHPPGCGNWYIVRCVKHDLNWGESPLQAAGKHIVGPGHNGSSKAHQSVIEELGELVQDCDKQKAEASNNEYRKAVNDQEYEPKNKMGRPKRRETSKPAKRNSGQISGHEPSAKFEGVTDPVVGGVYQAWWNGDPRSWYLAVILPYLGDGNCEEIGIAGNLFTSGLNPIPECFKKANITTDSGEKTPVLRWAEGFQDGGPRTHDRLFPCLFLHDPVVKIPRADEEFVLGKDWEVLAFIPAGQLRPQSTKLPRDQPKLGAGVHNQGLARDWQERLRAIRARGTPAPEKAEGCNVGGQAASMRNEQRRSTTTSIGPIDSFHGPPASGVQDLGHHNIGSKIALSGNEPQDISGRHGVDSQNPKTGLFSWLGSTLSGWRNDSQSAHSDQEAGKSSDHLAAEGGLTAQPSNQSSRRESYPGASVHLQAGESRGPTAPEPSVQARGKDAKRIKRPSQQERGSSSETMY